MIGRDIAHYKILEKLGEGGMGVVYKAKDTKLKRDVAIKFLPRQIVASKDERQRFKIEAQAAAALNHPNIATIYAIEEHDEEIFIVMEYIDGRELRDIVGAYRNTPLPVDQIINYATQIAAGLQAAHEKGVVHRDIKSANLMVTDKGQIKIMDFGLAKVGGGPNITKAGSTVGTPYYMSPEQASGKPVDARTDIWAFGVVLYEMLTGELPFNGEYEQAITYAIINEAPLPLKKMRTNIPEFLQTIVDNCLAKNPDLRYRSVADVLREFKRKPESSAIQLAKTLSDEETISPKPSKNRTFFLIGIISLLVIISAFLTIVLLRQPSLESNSEKVITRLTSSPGLEDEPAWSPDGKFIAYTSNAGGNMNILVKPLGGGRLIRLVENDADDGQPSWSPDGSKLAFVSARDRGGHLSIALGIGPVQNYVIGKGGDIFLIPAFGGSPEKLIDNGYYPSWSPNGRNIVFQSPRSGEMDLWRIATTGGTPVQLTRDPDFDFHPAWSPDGKWIVYCSGINEVYNLKVISASGSTPRVLTDTPHFVLRPAWSPDGKYIIYASNRSGSINLWKIPFSTSNGSKLPRSQQVTLGQGADQNVSVSPNGNKIVYSTVSVNLDIWEFTPSTGAYRQITSETSEENFPRLSPDGKTLLITSDRGGLYGLWSIDLPNNKMQKLSRPDVDATQGSWSPDGKQVAYLQTGESENYLFVRLPGSLSPRKIAANSDLIEYPIWSPDGKKLAFMQKKNDAGNIWVFDLKLGKAKKITHMQNSAAFATWSPEGRFLTFQTQKGSIRHLWIIPSGGGTPRQLSFGNEEHSHPQWSPTNPDVILFDLNHKNLCTVSVATGKIEQLTRYKQSDLVLDYPSWSPNGKKIYYSISRKQGDIYTLNNY